MTDKNIYLDNAATTFPKPEQVYMTLDSFARSGGANANRGNNPMARNAAKKIEETRAKVLHWLAAPGEAIVIFSPSATIALNQAILGTELTKGQAVYVSPFEHNSVLRSVEHLRLTQEIQVHEIPFHPISLEVDWDRLETAFRTEPPAMLAITQASNVCGLLLPVEQLALKARQVNPEVMIIVDGAQAAGLYPLNLSNGLIDYLIFSGHKSFYGPFGVAGLILCSSKRPNPILFGGTGTYSSKLSMPDEPPSAYEPGSLNSPAIAALGAALDWLKVTGRETLVTHAAKLTDYLEKELSRIPSVRVIKVPLEKRAAVISFTMQGVAPQALEEFLGTQGIAVRAGLHCSPWAHRFLDTQARGGTVRVSLGFFNAEEDIKQLLNVIESLLD